MRITACVVLVTVLGAAGCLDLDVLTNGGAAPDGQQRTAQVFSFEESPDQVSSEPARDLGIAPVDNQALSDLAERLCDLSYPRLPRDMVRYDGWSCFVDGRMPHVSDCQYGCIWNGDGPYAQKTVVASLCEQIAPAPCVGGNVPGRACVVECPAAPGLGCI